MENDYEIFIKVIHKVGLIWFLTAKFHHILKTLLDGILDNCLWLLLPEELFADLINS